MQFREDVLPERGAPPDDDPNDAVTRLAVVVRPSLVDGMSDPVVSEALARDIAGVSPLLTEDATLTSLVAAFVEDENPTAFADPFEEARRKRIEHDRDVEPTKVSARFEAERAKPEALFDLNLGRDEGTRALSLEVAPETAPAPEPFGTTTEPMLEREVDFTRILCPFPTPTNGVRTPFAMVAAAPSRVEEPPSTYPPMPHPLFTPAPPAWTSPTLPPLAPSRGGAWIAAAVAAALVIVSAGFYGVRAHQKHAAASVPSAALTALPSAAAAAPAEAPAAALPTNTVPFGPEAPPPRKKAARPRPAAVRP
jgi:hypothetical protein